MIYKSVLLDYECCENQKGHKMDEEMWIEAKMCQVSASPEKRKSQIMMIIKANQSFLLADTVCKSQVKLSSSLILLYPKGEYRLQFSPLWKPYASKEKTIFQTTCEYMYECSTNIIFCPVYLTIILPVRQLTMMRIYVDISL